MLGSEILDVALGLVFIYLLLSLIASAVREAAEMVIKARAVHLERGIREMLQDPTGAEWACKIYTHPYVSSLFKDTYTRKRTRWVGWNLPTYIPARSFAAALVDTVVRGEVPDDTSTAACGDAPNGGRKVARGDALNGYRSSVADDNVTDDRNAAIRVAVTDSAIGTQEAALTIESLRAATKRITNPRLRRVMMLAMDHAGDDVMQVQAHVEQWYNEAMDRVSGTYRRRTQVGLFVIALTIAAGMNIDSIALADHLWQSKSARTALAARAERFTHDSVSARAMMLDSAASAASLNAQMRELRSLALPIGWPAPTPTPWPLKLFGVLVTVFAISLGAPFWFDALKRIMVIRSTVKPGSADNASSGETSQGATTGNGVTGGSRMASVRLIDVSQISAVHGSRSERGA